MVSRRRVCSEHRCDGVGAMRGLRDTYICKLASKEDYRQATRAFSGDLMKRVAAARIRDRRRHRIFYPIPRKRGDGIVPVYRTKRRIRTHETKYDISARVFYIAYSANQLGQIFGMLCKQFASATSCVGQ